MIMEGLVRLKPEKHVNVAAQPEMKKDGDSRQNGTLAAAHLRTGMSIPTPIFKSPALSPVSQGPSPALQRRSHQGTTSQLKFKGRELILELLRHPVQGKGGYRVAQEPELTLFLPT